MSRLSDFCLCVCVLLRQLKKSVEDLEMFLMYFALMRTVVRDGCELTNRCDCDVEAELPSMRFHQ